MKWRREEASIRVPAKCLLSPPVYVNPRAKCFWSVQSVEIKSKRNQIDVEHPICTVKQSKLIEARKSELLHEHI